MLSMVWGGVRGILQRSRAWVRRHPYISGVIGVASLGALTGYLGLQYVKYKFEQLRLEAAEQRRLQSHIDEFERTADETALNFLPTCKSRLSRRFDVEGQQKAAAAAKSSTERVAVWEVLKNYSFGRTLASVYLTALLQTLLRVEFGVLGKHIYTTSGNRSGPQVSESTRLEFLFSVQYTLNEGADALATLVGDATASVLSTYKLDRTITSEELAAIVVAVRQSVEQRSFDTDTESATSHLVQFLLPQESQDTQGSDTDKALVARLINETRDILESPQFTLALQDALDSAFEALRRGAHEFLGDAASGVDSTSSSPNTTRAVVAATAAPVSAPAVNVSMPLARVIPRFAKLADDVFSDRQSNSYVQSVASSARLRELEQLIFSSV